jgi:hypothetical protein
MPETQTFDLAGHTWRVHPLELDEQWEVECILLRIAGPAAGHGLGAAIEGLAPALLELLKEEPPESLDIDGIMDFARRGDERLRESWADLIDGLATAVGGVARDASTTLLSRLDHGEILRLSELAVLTKLEVVREGVPSRVRDWNTLGLLVAREPSAKRDILAAALRVTYAPESFEPEEDDAGDA